MLISQPAVILSCGVFYGHDEGSLIQNDFVKCYDQPYSYASSSSDFSACSGYDVVFVGAKTSNSTNIIGIGAFGLSTGVFANTYSKTTAYPDAGGAYWYNYPGYGFGFAASSTVNLNTCDFGHGSPDCLSRMCWHVDQGIGGYRAGCTTHLNNNQIWRKVIYGGPQIYSCSPGMSKLLGAHGPL